MMGPEISYKFFTFRNILSPTQSIHRGPSVSLPPIGEVTHKSRKLLGNIPDNLIELVCRVKEFILDK